MKTINRTVKALALLTVCTLPIAARGADFFDNFDSYTAGNNIQNEGGGWIGWGGNALAAGLVSTDFAFSGANSVNISKNGVITAGSDLVHPFSGATNGLWTFSVMQYVPSSSAGESYMDVYSPGTVSGLKTSFNMATALVVTHVGTTATLSLIKDAWVPYRAEIDLGADTVSEYYNNALLSTHAWAGAVNEIQSVNFYFNNAGPVYYDDVSLVSVVPEPATVSLFLVGLLASVARRTRRA